MLSVKRELEDFALQIQHPFRLRYIFGLWKPNIWEDGYNEKVSDLALIITDNAAFNTKLIPWNFCPPTKNKQKKIRLSKSEFLLGNAGQSKMT